MLTRFEVSNFKNFNDNLVLDLTETKKFKFNEECVENSIVKKALIYGHNGTGKSNLGYAIFDIVKHLTAKNVNNEFYKHYTNADNEKKTVSFIYEFQFKSGKVRYCYTKEDYSTLLKEELEINNKIFASVDREKSTKSIINAKGAESLKKNIENKHVSIVSYIKNNAFLDEENKENKAFYEFIDFIENMLFFRSLNDGNSYMGHAVGGKEIDQDIIDHNNVKEFEKFLNKLDIKCELDVAETVVSKELVFVFKNKVIPFYDVASSGTRALALFYFWFQRMKEKNIKFIFIDEFDAFYHFELAKNIIEILKEQDIQIILTTHNTALMSNELLRPDCYFLIDNSKINNLSSLTVKELREAHNIEKMYKAHAFAI
jgi:AAA15 family ATPase/GTPase